MSVSSARYDILIADLKRIYANMQAAVKNGTATYASLSQSRDLMEEKSRTVKEKISFFNFSFFKDQKIKGLIKKADKLIEKMR